MVVKFKKTSNDDWHIDKLWDAIQRKNKDVMMDQMVEAHEEVSWCLMIIPWLLKNMLFNPYLAMHIIAPIIQGDQSLDCRSQTGVLIACFCFLPSFLFHVQILFYELACFSMFLYQDVLRLMEAQSKLVAANKQLKSVSWMAKISAHWSKNIVVFPGSSNIGGKYIVHSVCLNFANPVHTALNDSTFFGI